MAFFSVPDLVAVITVRLSFFSALVAPPLALVISTTSCRPAGILFSSAASSVRRNVRTRQIELVFRAVERSVADHHQHESVRRFGLRGDSIQRRFHLRARGVGAFQSFHDAIALAARLQDLIRVGGQHGEALLVIRLAAQTRDRQNVGRGERRSRGRDDQYKRQAA